VSTTVTFYAVREGGLFDWTAKLAETAWQKGRRMLVLCDNPTMAAELDEYLWTTPEDAFLPHELVSADDSKLDAEARIVISTVEANPNDAEILVLLTMGSMEFARSFGTVIELVDRSDDARVALSRERYRAWQELASDGEIELEYKG
jgi:DNA polymerase-3 subunit chi